MCSSPCRLNGGTESYTNRYTLFSEQPFMKLKKDRVEIESDANTRDGIGIEVYRNDEQVVEIFRDDRYPAEVCDLRFKKRK